MKIFLIKFGAIPLLLLLAGPTLACVGVPDLDLSIVRQGFEGLATLLVAPDGSGPPVTEARTPDGTVVDATIFLTLINNCGGTDPVPGFPREDMWLESMAGGVVFCQGGSIADAPTDQDGNTRWSQPLMGGGWDDGNCRVMINGMPQGPPEGLTLNLNSPDLSGDRVVNLIDVTLFAQDYFGGYAFRSDLYRDGVLNLNDLAALAGMGGRSCP